MKKNLKYYVGMGLCLCVLSHFNHIDFTAVMIISVTFGVFMGIIETDFRKRFGANLNISKDTTFCINGEPVDPNTVDLTEYGVHVNQIH